MQRNIIIAEDHPLFRTVLKQTLAEIFENPECMEADSIDVLQRIMENNREPDMVLLDLGMPGAHGLSGLQFMRGHYPNCPVAVISAYDKIEIMLKAMELGAAAFIPKSSHPGTLRQALTSVSKGEIWFIEKVKNAYPDYKKTHKNNSAEKGIALLTPQQFRILGMIGEGMLNKQIGYDLNISEATVKAHVTAIFKKLGVRSRTQAVITLKSLDLDSPSSSTTNDIP